MLPVNYDAEKLSKMGPTESFLKHNKTKHKESQAFHQLQFLKKIALQPHSLT